ncbi:MAG: hypothetical protein KAI79_14005 [Bacteroidales bacterium]|nr:hypothetical protein [Bacteroidales bacterium]
MKTFMAQGVLCDYTCGMFVIVAKDIETAKQIITDGFLQENIVDELCDALEELKPNDFAYTYGGG